MSAIITDIMTIHKDDLQYLLARSEEWARNADVKIGVILAFDGVFVLTITKHALLGISQPENSSFLRVACVFVLILLVWSIEKALWGILPRLRHNQDKPSLLYYYDVHRMPLASYRRSFKTLSAVNYKEQLVLQNYALANIVSRKMVCFKESVILLAACLTIMGGVEIWQLLMI